MRLPGARGVLATAALLAAAAPHASGLPAMPGPRAGAPSREGAAADNARCEGCHAEIAEEWRASLHRASHVDAAYARALSAEPMPFCRGCHAPEASPDREPPEALASIGTACVTCHVTGEGVLAAPRAAARDSDAKQGARAPHRVVRDARFASTAACAGCHEFDFPGILQRPRERMQETVSEHEGSPYAALACAECHMPRVGGPGGHRSHAFAAPQSSEAMREAATIHAFRSGPTSVRVTLAAREVGHAFPTGDLFRRLTVSAEVAGGPRAERHLMRHFGERRVGLAAVRTEVSDDRVPASGAERVVDLDLGPRAAGVPIRCRVDYERVEHPLSRDGEDALVGASIPLADTILPPRGPDE